MLHFIRTALFLLTFLHSLAEASLVAEYRFDGCNWNGTQDEIIDSIDTHHATAINGTVPTAGKINNSADMKGNNYVELSNLLTLDTWSISLWIKFPFSTSEKTAQGGNYYYVLASVAGDGDLAYFAHEDGKTDIWWGVYNNDKTISENDFPDDLTGWHHVTFINDKSSTKLYIDGSYENEVNKYTTGNLKYIGTSSDDPDGQTIGALLDEIKFYDTALTSTQIQDIYDADLTGNNTDGTVRSIPICTLKTEYRFDSCAWDGTTNEIIDSSDNGTNGTAINGTNPAEGKINNASHFDGVDDYIDFGNVLNPNESPWSISVWFKAEKVDGENIIYNKESLYESGVRDGYFQYAWQPHWNWDGGNSFPVTENTWYHAVVTYDGNKQKVYKDGQLVYEREQSGDIGSNSQDFRIGNRTDYDNDFKGNIDELKIFNVALTPNQVLSIYDNENSAKNYDGNTREPIDCSMPTPVANYHLDACKYEQTFGEVLDSSGHNNHLTSNIGTDSISSGKVARAANFDGVDARMYGTWNQPFTKEVTLTAWINTSNPKGDDYARIIAFTNSAGEWQPGTAIAYDADGYIIRGWTANSSSRSNTVSYDLNANGYHDGNWHFLAFTYYQGISKLYVDGTKVDSDFKDIGTIQKGETISIGGDQTSNNLSYKGAIDEVKVFDRALTPTQILDLFNTESSLVRTITCAQAILNAVNQNGGCFNWDNNITTKIADKPINLTILSRDKETNTSISDVNITKLELLSFSDAACTSLYNTSTLWDGNEAVDTNGCFNPASFTHNKAIKCAKVKITALYEGETVESNSSDTFSIRPEKFILTPTLDAKLISEHAYTFQVEAQSYQSTTRTPDFNQSLTTPTSSLLFREGSPNDGSLEGVFSLNPNNLSFTDGLTPEGNISFNNVGILTLEINDTTWAEVDSDDTPLAERRIYVEQNLTFIPDHFDIGFISPIMINHLDGDFTYLSNDLNMSAWLKNLSVTLSAKGEKGGLMTNYATPQSLFYANDLNITTSLHILNNPIMIIPPTSENGAHLSFIAGVADVNYSDVRFNYPRDYKVPSEPIMIDGGDANLSIQVSDIVDTTVRGEGTSLFSGDATFYYGKIVPEDIKTGEDSVPSKSLIEIYSTTNLSGFKKETSRWYINKDDNISTILGLLAKESRSISSATSTYTSAQNILTADKGVIPYDLVNTHDNSYKAFYHLDIPNWLWHSQYSDYNASSNCSEHPCFEYIYESENTNITGIQSGVFKGSAFASDFNTSTKRKAIKLLR